MRKTSGHVEDGEMLRALALRENDLSYRRYCNTVSFGYKDSSLKSRGL